MSKVPSDRELIEQLQVQLAGYTVAALGGTKEPATPGMYGWSPAYQDVLELRLKYDAILQATDTPAQSSYSKTPTETDSHGK